MQVLVLHYYQQQQQQLWREHHHRQWSHLQLKACSLMVVVVLLVVYAAVSLPADRHRPAAAAHAAKTVESGEQLSAAARPTAVVVGK